MTLGKIIKNVTKEEVKIARKNILRAGDIAHFGGEIMIVGAVAYTCFNYIFADIPPFNWFNLKVLGEMLIANVFLQPTAFFLKGLSMNEEANYLLAQKFEKESQETTGLESKASKGISRMHSYFANNPEKYNNLIKKYIWLLT